MSETIKDILAEIGEKSDFCHNNISTKTWEDWEQMHEWLLNLRSRIEGFALRRAIELSKQFVPGNAAAMREALDDIVGIAKIALNVNAFGNSNNSELWKIIDKCKSALAVPARNCDVGTAEEQAARYNAYCYRMMKQNNHCCGPCPLFKFVNGEAQSCTLLWAQMPYEAQEGGAK